MISHETAIKSCPFCAHAHVYVEAPLAGEDMATVSCARCGAIGPVVAQQTVSEAVYRWNVREGATPAPTADELAAEDVNFFLSL